MVSSRIFEKGQHVDPHKRKCSLTFGIWNKRYYCLHTNVILLVGIFSLDYTNPVIFRSRSFMYRFSYFCFIYILPVIVFISTNFFCLKTCWEACMSPTLCDPMDCSLPGSVHGIFQARILEWVASFFSRGSFLLRDQACVSCTAGNSLPTEPSGNKTEVKWHDKTLDRHSCLVKI